VHVHTRATPRLVKRL